MRRPSVPRCSPRSPIPRWTIVTLTVTEKGYRPGSEIIALLAEGLARRTEPATVLSLDNLPRNGEVLAVAWCGVGERGHRFPCTMVDRVVPATTDADRAAVARALGVEDRGRGRRRAVPAVGDRGLRRPAAGLGRAVRLLQRAARGAQAAPAQRHPFAAGLRRAAARRAHGRRRLGRRGSRRRRAPPRRRGSRPDVAAGSRASTSPTTARSSHAAGPTRGSSTGSRRSRSTAIRSCRPGSPSRPASGSPPAVRRAGSRSRSPPTSPTAGRVRSSPRSRRRCTSTSTTGSSASWRTGRAPRYAPAWAESSGGAKRIVPRPSRLAS